MLQPMLESLQLKVLEEKALPAIWINEASSLTAGELFKLLVNRGSVLHYYFNLGAADAITKVSDGSPELVSDYKLCHVMRLIAINYGHRLVNEVHVMAALFKLFPKSFDQQLASLQAIRMENLREAIREGASERTIQKGGGKLAKLAARLGPNIREFPFGCSKVVTMLEEYLDSPYFPFTVNDWHEYKRMKSKGPSHRRNVALACFSAHWMRDKHSLGLGEASP